MNSTTTTTTTNATTAEKKAKLFTTCKVYIREHKEGPTGSHLRPYKAYDLQRETGYDQTTISKLVRMLHSEGAIAYQPGNYRTMVIPRRPRQRRCRPTALWSREVQSPIVERRRALLSQGGEPPPAPDSSPARSSSEEHSHLKSQLFRLRAQWAERISAAVTLTGLFIGKAEGDEAPVPLGTDVLAAPSQAVKEELVTLRTKWQSCLDALDLVIAHL